MRNEINLNVEQIEQVFDDAFNVCICAEEDSDNLTFTRESLADFLDAAKGYSEAGVPVQGETSGFKTLFIPRVQVARGARRTDLHVVDFGTVRAVYR